LRESGPGRRHGAGRARDVASQSLVVGAGRWLPGAQRAEQHDLPIEKFRRSIERDVRYANIAIIEGNDACQYGIGMISARIAEIVLRDEREVIPIGCYNPAYGVTLSLPAIVGRRGILRSLELVMSVDERQALQRSADALRSALTHVSGAMV
jgi:L-lactate dehydrogenase